MKSWFKRGKENKIRCNCGSGTACGGGFYFFGFLGSLIFYLQQSTTFWQGVVSFLKAIVWPAFLVYKMFGN